MWEELGEQFGVDVIDDEEVEQDEEDREVEKIINTGREAKRKLAKGTVLMSDRLNLIMYSTVHVLHFTFYVCRTGRTGRSVLYLLAFSCQDCCRGPSDGGGMGGDCLKRQ